MNKKRFCVCAVVSIVIATCVILFWDILFSGYKFSYTNILYMVEPFSSMYVPRKGMFASDMADSAFCVIKHLFDDGRINEWSRYNLFGHTSYSAIYLLSPFMWLLYGLTSIGQFVRYILKDVLMLGGMYLFLKESGCSKIASWVGGVVYCFSSAIILWGGWPHTDVSCLAPLLFFFTHVFVRKYKEKESNAIYYLMGISLILYFMLVAGMPTYAMYFLYLGVAYELYNMIGIQHFNAKQIFGCVLMIGVAILLAGFMSFAYTGEVLITTQDYQAYRKSSEIDYAWINVDGKYLLSLLFPTMFAANGSDIEYNVFSGIFCTFIIPLALITKKDKNKRFWLITAVLILVIVFVTQTGYVFQYFPLINSSRRSRIIVLFNFSISILSAKLISQLTQKQIKYERKRIVSALCGIILITVLYVLFKNVEYIGVKTAAIYAICYLVLAFSIYMMLFAKKVQVSMWLLIASISISGAAFGRCGLQLIDKDASVIPAATSSIQYLQKNASKDYRMATVGEEIFPPNLNSYYDILNLCSHSFKGTENKVINYLEGIDSDIYDIPTRTSIKKLDNQNLLLYSGVRYLLIKQERVQELDLKGLDYNTINFDDGESVIELEETQPRTYVATNVVNCESSDKVLENMKKEYRKNTIFLADGRQETNDVTASIEGSSAQITNQKNDSIIIQSHMDGSGYVVLTDSCDTNWKAYVNGKEQKIINCNYLFEAVYIDNEGDYEIELVYDNDETDLYWAITVVAWICWIMLIVFGRVVVHKRISNRKEN